MKPRLLPLFLAAVLPLPAGAQEFVTAPAAARPGAPVPPAFRQPAVTPSGPEETADAPPPNVPVLRTTYDRWLPTYFTAAILGDPTKQATVWGRNADADTDGVPNGLEYFFGTSPTQAGPPPAVTLTFTTISGQTYPVVSFPHRKFLSDPNFRVEVQTTTDLAATPFATVPTTLVSTTTPVDPADPAETITYRSLTPVASTSAPLFARLRVTPLLADTDGDGLADEIENGSHVYNGPNSPGTDPNNADTDGDGIPDGDETLGTFASLNLPQMGCNPLKKNILLEYDWFDDALECSAHSHRPTQAALDRVAIAFASAPVVSPDGTLGIAVLQDRGDGGVFSGGNRVSNLDSAANIAGGVNEAAFKNYKATSFSSNRQGYFHYVLMPHRYGTNSASSGQAEINGNDLIVSLYCFGSDVNVANTIVHELGHNLGLRHGGNVDTNYKPNYNSVMNYQFQFPGVNTNCGLTGTGLLDYSRGVRITLNENALNENQGVCGNTPVDFNNNGTLETNLSLDLNQDGAKTTLTDFNDWANLNFRGLTTDTDGLSPMRLEVVDCDNPPPQP